MIFDYKKLVKCDKMKLIGSGFMSKKAMEKKKFKNYILLLLLFALGIGITLYLCKLYRVYDEYQKETPVIRGVISEINNEELEHFIMENPTILVYMCTSSDMICRNYEKDFKKLIEKKNLQEEFVYLNLSDIDQEEFVQSFNEKYHYKSKLAVNYPAIVMFEDGVVRNILQGSKEKKYWRGRVISFFLSGGNYE